MHMNYERIYNNIITNRLSHPITDEYTECHHILPHSLGGSDDKTNLVNLLAREHFICHLLLTKMYPKASIEWVKMMNAFMRMYSFGDNQSRYVNNKWYEYLKINFSKAQSLSQSGVGNSQYGKCWISNLQTKECKSIHKKELQNYLDNGWIKKRILNWDAYVYVNGKPIYKTNKRLNQFNDWNQHVVSCKEYFTHLYSIYNEYGIKGVYEMTDYKHSRQNLVQQMKKYVDNFVPQNGKKRGKRY